jgi:uncharacterized membrane protein YgdD (TMEM256/DUF423 family)
MSKWAVTAALLLAAGVALGAFGAHGLKERVDAYYLTVWEKAVFYQLIHAMGLFLVALLPRLNMLSAAQASATAAMFFAGILLFSGSLYVLVLLQLKWLGAITPFGGVAFILGWLLLAWQLARQ